MTLKNKMPDSEFSRVGYGCMETIQNATSIEIIRNTLNLYDGDDIILSLRECIDRSPVPIESVELESFRSAILFILQKCGLLELDISINLEGITEISFWALSVRESRSAPDDDDDDGLQTSFLGILVLAFFTSGNIEYHTSPRLLDAGSERLDVNGITSQDNIMDKIRPFLVY